MNTLDALLLSPGAVPVAVIACSLLVIGSIVAVTATGRLAWALAGAAPVTIVLAAILLWSDTPADPVTLRAQSACVKAALAARSEPSAVLTNRAVRAAVDECSNKQLSSDDEATRAGQYEALTQ